MSDLRTHNAAENADEGGLDPTRTRRHARCFVPSITLRPSAEEKARFKLLAQHVGLSESALALNAIRALLERDDAWFRRQSPLNPQHVAATDRITIRLRPGDGLAVIQRATERGFKPATYISALVRAHITANPRLPSAEVLHIDKAMLREWRQDFAQMMREQGIAANATPRSVRGQTKRATKDAFYRTRQRGQSYALREKLDGVVRELSQARAISDPARARLLKTREAVVAAWNAVAAKLES